MQFIKQKIKLKPTVDQNIPIFFSENVESSGLQEDIDNYVEEQTGLSINDVDDGETFRYLPDGSESMRIYWFSGGSYSSKDNGYEYAGFTTGETSSRSEVILRSFYIMQVYDSTSTQNQTLLHTGYFNGYNFLNINSGQTLYTFDAEEEYTNLYIPQWFIESVSGQTTTLYGKVSFYNAKTGKLQLFSHGVTPGFVPSRKPPTVDEDYYFEIELIPSGLTYNVGTIWGYELQNTDYIDKINNTVSSFSNQKPTYPTGNTFINTGRYIDNT
jgi:hypothetical protein